MKQIIKGRLYNTDTAKEIGCYRNGSIYDAHGFRETLYQKRTGEFFIHGEGGGFSGYGRHCPDGWTSGEKIRLLSYEDARKWVEKYLSVDKYEAIFGVPSEDGEDVQLHVSIPERLMAALKNAAGANGESVTAYVTRILEDAAK